MARQRRRLGGFPLAVYVVAVLVIPLAAVAVLGLREVERNNTAANEARAIADAVEINLAATNVLVPLQIEQIASLGLVRVDALGLDRDTAGAEFEAMHLANVDRLDAAYAALTAALVDSRTGSPLVAATGESKALLDDTLQRAVQGDASFEHVATVFAAAFAQLDAILRYSEVAINESDLASVEASGYVREVGLLTDVLATAHDELSTLSSSVLLGRVTTDAEMMSGGIRHGDALNAAERVSPSKIAELRIAHAALPQLYDTAMGGPTVTIAGGDVDAVSDLLQSHVEYQESVAAFTSTHGASVLATVDGLADEASDRNQLALVVFAAVGLLSLLFALTVMQSFASPLTRLRLQAERISRGELNAEPLPLAGPSDVRKVTGALNDMSSTLSLVDDHMSALALAQPGAGPVLQQLPGKVGASMRSSMERVTALTTRLQTSEARLAAEARIDNLTGLPNRFAVLEYIDRSVHVLPPADASRPEGLRTAGVMFVDVDGFKSVNDTHGHAVGDVVLREIAQRLRGSVREVDFVARLGGDEFLIVVADVTNPDTITAFGERLIREIEQPYTIGDQLFAVSASIGGTMLESGDDSMSAIERADAAVYQAKRRGRRRVEMFDKDLQRSIEHQAELELALRQAIHHEELRIYLQPLADLRTGMAVGAEALVRWERPGVGLVPPADFIPIAERSGLIFDLERWVLEAACTRIAEWQLLGKGQGLRVAVNISGRHLIEGDLLADLDAALTATGADPTNLEIELTESQLLDDVGRASSVLAAVRDRGVMVAIDDFGTGYSSMTYLQKLPVDVVKIDRSFISGATANTFDSTIVESVVTIGRALTLDIVAEGIETFDQLVYALRAGVTVGQGYLIARPLPAKDAEPLLFAGQLIDMDRVRRDAGLEHLAWADRPWTDRPPSGDPVALDEVV